MPYAGLMQPHINKQSDSLCLTSANLGVADKHCKRLRAKVSLEIAAGSFGGCKKSLNTVQGCGHRGVVTLTGEKSMGK